MKSSFFVPGDICIFSNVPDGLGFLYGNICEVIWFCASDQTVKIIFHHNGPRWSIFPACGIEKIDRIKLEL